MEKKVMFFVLIFLLVAPVLVMADHGFWNEVSEWWNGFRGNVVGKAAVMIEPSIILEPNQIRDAALYELPDGTLVIEVSSVVDPKNSENIARYTSPQHYRFSAKDKQLSLLEPTKEEDKEVIDAATRESRIGGIQDGALPTKFSKDPSASARTSLSILETGRYPQEDIVKELGVDFSAISPTGETVYKRESKEVKVAQDGTYSVSVISGEGSFSAKYDKDGKYTALNYDQSSFIAGSKPQPTFINGLQGAGLITTTQEGELLKEDATMQKVLFLLTANTVAATRGYNYLTTEQKELLIEDEVKTLQEKGFRVAAFEPPSEPPEPPAAAEPAPATEAPAPPAEAPPSLKLTVPEKGKASISDDNAALLATLKELGYDPSAFTGEEAKKKDDMIRAFQKAHGLGVDGEVGHDTATEINAALDFKRIKSGTSYTVSAACAASDDCTMASLVLSPAQIADSKTTPQKITIGADTYEPFFEKGKWDYCKGNGCAASTDGRKVHAKLPTGGELSLAAPPAEEAPAAVEAAPAPAAASPTPPPAADFESALKAANTVDLLAHALDLADQDLQTAKNALEAEKKKVEKGESAEKKATRIEAAEKKLKDAEVIYEKRQAAITQAAEGIGNGFSDEDRTDFRNTAYSNYQDAKGRSDGALNDLTAHPGASAVSEVTAALQKGDAAAARAALKTAEKGLQSAKPAYSRTKADGGTESVPLQVTNNPDGTKTVAQEDIKGNAFSIVYNLDGSVKELEYRTLNAEKKTTSLQTFTTQEKIAEILAATDYEFALADAAYQELLAETEAVKNAGEAITKFEEAKLSERIFNIYYSITSSPGSSLAFISQWLRSTPRFPRISNAIFEVFDEEESYKEYKQGVESAFSNLYLGEQFTALICENHAYDVSPEEGVAMIELAPGSYQFVASIQAEQSKTKNQPLFCEPDHTCKNEYFCKDGLCYKEETATTPVMTFFYKITWSVTAPRDLQFTLLQDEARNQIDFNLQIDNNWVFVDAETKYGNQNTNHLGLGNTSAQLGLPPTIIDFSETDYDRACIVFGTNKPRDYGGWDRKEVDKVCVSIIDSDLGQVNWEEGTTSSGTQYASSGTSHAGSYCGLDGEC